jgi:chlorobactene glucosyltransferase
MVAELEASGFDALTVFPRLRLESFWEKVAMPQLATLFFSTVPAWLSNRTRLPLLGVGGGPGNLVSRVAYDRAGAHDSVRDAVVDDVGLMRNVRAAGGRTIVVRSGELVSLRMYSSLREIVDGFTKNAYAALGSSLFASAFALVMLLVVHLMPYVWLTQWLINGATFQPVAAALGAAIVPLMVVTRLLLFASLQYDLRFALFAHPLMALVWGFIIARSTWLAGIRKRIVWRGREYDSRNTR